MSSTAAWSAALSWYSFSVKTLLALLPKMTRPTLEEMEVIIDINEFGGGGGAGGGGEREGGGKEGGRGQTKLGGLPLTLVLVLSKCFRAEFGAFQRSRTE